MHPSSGLRSLQSGHLRYESAKQNEIHPTHRSCAVPCALCHIDGKVRQAKEDYCYLSTPPMSEGPFSGHHFTIMMTLMGRAFITISQSLTAPAAHISPSPETRPDADGKWNQAGLLDPSIFLVFSWLPYPPLDPCPPFPSLRSTYSGTHAWNILILILHRPVPCRASASLFGSFYGSSGPKNF